MAQALAHKAILVTKDDNSVINVVIKDANNQYITSGTVNLVITNNDLRSPYHETLLTVAGTYSSTSNEWSFTIPPDADLSGRYTYHFLYNGVYLDFPEAIYFI